MTIQAILLPGGVMPAALAYGALLAALGDDVQDKPVLFALGGKSNPDYYGQMAKRAGATFPHMTLEVFPERHHFDPPHRIEPSARRPCCAPSGSARAIDRRRRRSSMILIAEQLND